jgi:hypothetical protein
MEFVLLQNSSPEGLLKNAGRIKKDFVGTKSCSEPYSDQVLAIKEFGCYTSIVTRRPSTEPPDVNAASSD